MHGLFSKPQFRSKWIWRNLILLFLLHFICTALSMHARLQKAISIEGCEAGRQHTHTVQHSRKSTAGKTRSTGSGTNNCSLWACEPLSCLCGCETNTSIASSHKNIFFIVGHFLWKHKRNPSTWRKSFNAKKRLRRARQWRSRLPTQSALL